MGKAVGVLAGDDEGDIEFGWLVGEDVVGGELVGRLVGESVGRTVGVLAGDVEGDIVIG